MKLKPLEGQAFIAPWDVFNDLFPELDRHLVNRFFDPVFFELEILSEELLAAMGVPE